MDRRAIGLGILICCVCGLFVAQRTLPLWLSLPALVAGVLIIADGVLQGRAARAMAQDSTRSSDG